MTTFDLRPVPAELAERYLAEGAWDDRTLGEFLRDCLADPIPESREDIAGQILTPDNRRRCRREDRQLLPLKDAVNRAATGITVLERARFPQPRPPVMRATVSQIQHPARPRVRPALRHGLVNQPQQLELDLRAHARGDRAEKPERCLPR